MRACLLLWLILPAWGQTARVGELRTLLASGEYGLEYFPDEGLTILPQGSGYRALLAAGVSTYLLEGPEIASLKLVTRVLAPGAAGSFDNGYAGAGGAWRDPATGEIRAVYHAEDQEEMPRLSNGVNGFYASVALAVSRDHGLTFVKAGRILTSHQPKNAHGHSDQGCGEPSVTPDRDHHFLYCFYTDHSRDLNPGVGICLARSRMEDKGAPGTWKKYHAGAFAEAGLGGQEDPVISAAPRGDALFPNVSYSPALRKYVMVYNILIYSDLRADPAQGGIYAAFSDDLVHWGSPQRLVRGLSVAQVGREVLWHPAIVWDPNGKPQGWLVYGYSPSWGHDGARQPHYMVGRRITFL